MTIPVEPAVELAAAAEEYGRAVEALAEVEAASAKWPSVHEEAGHAGGLAALCARRRSAGGLRAGTPPGIPGRLPATPQETELCGWKRNDRGEVWLTYITTAEPSRIHRYFEEALLDEGHTIEPWDPEAAGPNALGFEFGNMRWGGSVIVDRSGDVDVRVVVYDGRDSGR